MKLTSEWEDAWLTAWKKDRRAVRGIVMETLKGGYTNEDIEDLMQEAYAKAFMALPTYDEEQSSFLTWLCNITKSVTVDYIKAEEAKKRPALVFDVDLRGVDDEGLVVSYEDLCSDPCDDPAEQVAAEDYYHEALSRMPKQMRQCVELRQNGHSNLEIATELGIADKTVRNLISDGRVYFEED